MVQFGCGVIVTVLLQVFVQPAPTDVVRFTVYEPEAPAFTTTDDPVVEPLIVPLPLTDQA